MSEKLPIYEIKLTRGQPLYNVAVDLEARQIPGFIALIVWLPTREQTEDGAYL